MFLFATGIVLPPADQCDRLVHRPELWRLLSHDLAQQFSEASGCEGVLWIVDALGKPVPECLEGWIGFLVRQLPDVQLLKAVSLAGAALDCWLRSSTVVVFLELEEGRQDGDPGDHLLRCERLSHALPQHLNLLLEAPEHGDGLIRISRYAGRRLLEANQTRFPLATLSRYEHFWQNTQEQLMARMPRQELSAEGWKAAMQRQWTLEIAQGLMQRRDRGLLWKLLLLLAVVLIMAPVLAWPASRWLPGLLLIGSLLMAYSGQPQRQRALRWWVFGQTLWLQDVWHRFGLAEEAAERLPVLQPLESRADRGLLLHLLRSHQLALLVAEPSPDWQQPQVSDLLAVMDRDDQRLTIAMDQQQWLQRWMAVAGGGIVLLLLLSLVMPGTVWLQQAIVALGVLLINLWGERPLPRLSHPRLRRHQQTLQRELLPLKQALAGLDLQQPAHRRVVATHVQRLGSELMDLANDALERSFGL